MTITVDIRPEVQAELARQAAAGRPIEAYAEKRKREGRTSLVEVCAMVRGLTDDVDFSRNPAEHKGQNFTRPGVRVQYGAYSAGRRPPHRAAP